MDEAARAKLEGDARNLCRRGDHSGAATLAVKGYGPELFGFLVAVLHDDVEAGEVFAELAEALWRGLPTFAWESSLRTWSYAIARNLIRTRRRDAARRRRHRPNTGESALDERPIGPRRGETRVGDLLGVFASAEDHRLDHLERHGDELEPRRMERRHGQPLASCQRLPA